MKTLLIIAGLLAASAAQAQVYKCSEGGRTVFSDTPCAGGSGGQIDVRPSSGAAPTFAPGATPINSSTNPKAVLAQIERERELRSIDFDIDALERTMEADSRRMGAELDALKAKKGQANNNLAGATWEASISQEMLVVTQRYQMKATADQLKLEQLREQRARLMR